MTIRAEAKAGDSDPAAEHLTMLLPRGWAVAQRIKVTLGITG